MIQSMTGYAAGERSVGKANLHLELKSVNSRFLDLAFRAEEGLRFLEMPLRETLAARIQRGKLECRLHLADRPDGAVKAPALNVALLDQLAAWQKTVRAAFPDAASLSVADLLRWPAMLGEDSADAALIQQECLILANGVMDDFLASRKREGARLAAIMLERAARMRALALRVGPLLPQALGDYQERLATRLREAVTSLDEERIRQEIGIFAARIDVAEELARLLTHLDEVERVIGQGGPVGKRLDFLMQELNREANTLASKSVTTEITGIALDLKLLIEQLREQAQNLE